MMNSSIDNFTGSQIMLGYAELSFDCQRLPYSRFSSDKNKQYETIKPINQTSVRWLRIKRALAFLLFQAFDSGIL